ncbi:MULTISPECIES: hypothetical protein [unclassified Chryseobacterium]|uniref:phage baseplate protein n=1 Tax=unclassified Chryseobacterium TaxID=2593645 RepID=UPI002269A785|nr:MULTISPECIES: hypothetical protein [unclassified Chryseobacterium]
MKYNFKFLQTGGVPLTNDLMALIEEAYEIFEVLGDLAGNKTILMGCETVGSQVNPGIVAIDGKLYNFEGGTVFSTVYIHQTDVPKTFEDQQSKILIEKREVKFGQGAGTNNYLWSEFVKLDTLRDLQAKVNNMASQPDVSALAQRVAMLELKTAPIINGGIVMPWRKPVSEIPIGWKECLDFRGKTIVGWNPNELEFSVLGSEVGSKTHTLSRAELPNFSMSFQLGLEKVGTGNRNGLSKQGGNEYTQYIGSGGANQPHNNIQPSRIALYIEPNFQ